MKVVNLKPKPTRASIEEVFDQIKNDNLEEVIIIGMDSDDTMFMSHNAGATANVNFIIDKAKKFILDGEFE